MSKGKNRGSDDDSTDPIYSCDSCGLEFLSANEMVRHYKEMHPDSVESVTIPI